MGDISEIRGLVVVGSFLAVTVLLIGFIPSAFYQVGEQRTVEPPDYFESADIAHLNFTYQIDIDDPGYNLLWGKNEFGHHMRFEATYFGGATGGVMLNEHGYTFLGIWTGGHKQEWINDQGVSRGKELWDDEIEGDFDEDTEYARYTVKCKHFYMVTYISYNVTAYNSTSEAWANNDLHLLFGIDWDQRGTTWDAWSLITGVLFFKLPNINPYLNALIAIPIWIAIAYISYILVLRALGAIFGGGA